MDTILGQWRAEQAMSRPGARSNPLPAENLPEGVAGADIHHEAWRTSTEETVEASARKWLRGWGNRNR